MLGKIPSAPPRLIDDVEVAESPSVTGSLGTSLRDAGAVGELDMKSTHYRGVQC